MEEGLINDNLFIKPLTLSNWDDFEDLFGSRGACGGCWCMSFRLNKKEFEIGKKDNVNKGRMRSLVESGRPAGIIGYLGRIPVSWMAFAPREDFRRFESSRVLKPLDDKPVWSLPCFFIRKEYRKRGLAQVFLEKLPEYAVSSGVEIIEAYPVIPKSDIPDPFIWNGILKIFERAGYTVAGGSASRPVVRKYLIKK